MDTRSKILSAARALEVAADLRHRRVPFTIVCGYFDVLQPGMARGIPERGIEGRPGTVFAVVLDPPSPLLPASVRAELAAALRMVDYVIPWSGDGDELMASLIPDACVNKEAEHTKSTERLIQHVWERHGREFERRRQN
jgi:hypothetical protein